jgi:hypothetical protein
MTVKSLKNRTISYLLFSMFLVSMGTLSLMGRALYQDLVDATLIFSNRSAAILDVVTRSPAVPTTRVILPASPRAPVPLPPCLVGNFNNMSTLLRYLCISVVKGNAAKDADENI